MFLATLTDSVTPLSLWGRTRVPSLTFEEGHAPVSAPVSAPGRPETQAGRQPWLDQCRLTQEQEILPGLLLTSWMSATLDAGHGGKRGKG